MITGEQLANMRDLTETPFSEPVAETRSGSNSSQDAEKLAARTFSSEVQKLAMSLSRQLERSVSLSGETCREEQSGHIVVTRSLTARFKE